MNEKQIEELKALVAVGRFDIIWESDVAISISQIQMVDTLGNEWEMQEGLTVGDGNFLGSRFLSGLFHIKEVA